MIFVVHDVLKSYKINLKEQNGLQHLLTKKLVYMEVGAGHSHYNSHVFIFKSPIKKLHTSNIPTKSTVAGVLLGCAKVSQENISNYSMHYSCSAAHVDTLKSELYFYPSNVTFSNLVSTMLKPCFRNRDVSFFPTHEKK